jgi:hypothetical protein
MRQRITSTVIQEFLRTLGRGSRAKSRIYLVGGASAVLLGWRDSTIDIDLKIVPDRDELLGSLPALKERLKINIELAAPDDFIPALPGWEERSEFISQEGSLTFLHYDFYAQALAKIERGHATDLKDVEEMIRRGLVKPDKLVELFLMIESQLYRYPAVDPKYFSQAVRKIASSSNPELPA